MTADAAFALGLLQGFALAVPFYFALDRLLDRLTRSADRVRPDDRR